MGGDKKQTLSVLDDLTHQSFHRTLSKELKDRGLPPMGSSKGSKKSWRQLMKLDPDLQRKALDALLEASRKFDRRNGTNLVRYVWKNIIDGNFTNYWKGLE